MLNNLSLVHRRSGDLAPRRTPCVRCLEMLRSTDSVSTGLYNLGQLAVELGEIDGAVEHFSQALALAPNADSHTYLGMALRLQGRLDEARTHLDRALEIGNVPAGEAETLENLAALELDSGNAEVGPVPGLTRPVAGRGRRRPAGGDHDPDHARRDPPGPVRLRHRRRACSTQALATARRIGYASGEVRALIDLAVVLRDLDHDADSRSAAEQAARRSAELGLRALENRARELELVCAHRTRYPIYRDAEYAIDAGFGTSYSRTHSREIGGHNGYWTLDPGFRPDPRAASNVGRTRCGRLTATTVQVRGSRRRNSPRPPGARREAGGSRHLA